MSNEEKLNLNMKTVILDTWKSKLSYPFNHQDLNELEKTIDYYEEHISYYKNQLEASEKARKEASHIVENNFLESTIESYVCLKTKDYLKLKKVLDIDKGE